MPLHRTALLPNSRTSENLVRPLMLLASTDRYRLLILGPSREQTS